MARKFLTALDLNKNELQNGVVQNLGTAPATPVKGQLYFSTSDNTLYWWDGTSWIPAKASGGAFPGYGSVPAETTFGLARADGVAVTVARSDHTHGSPTHLDADHSAIHLNALAPPNGVMDMNNFRVASVGAPTATTDAANKGYVDNLQAGLSWKEAVRLATTANIATLSGLAAIDGVTPVGNDRVLVKNQTTASQNGIYDAKSGAWTRSPDADGANEMDGAAVFVMEGSTQADTAWVCTTNAPITVGSTALAFAQFGAGTAYIAGAGLTLTSATFDVVAADASIVVTADAVAVQYAGTGTAVTAARSDHNHSGTFTRKFAASVAAAVSTVINHAFTTMDVAVEVYRVASPFDKIECDVEHTDVNNVTVRFATAPAAGEYRVVVVG